MSCLHKTKHDLYHSTAIRVHYFWFFAKMILLKVAHPLHTYQHTKCQGSMLTGASFAPRLKSLIVTMVYVTRLKSMESISPSMA
jgi:hypothetical protein